MLPKLSRHTSASKTGRRLMAQTPIREEQEQSKEIVEWNKKVDAEKRLKKLAKA